MLELTCCADLLESIDAARTRKNTRDSHLAADIDASANDWEPTYTTLEVCYLGTALLGRKKTKRLCEKLARISIACSYHIFNSRRTRVWGAAALVELSTD